MTRSGPRPRRPTLLLIVFSAFVALVGITATAQAALVSLHFSTSALNAIVASDAATIRAVLNDAVAPEFLDASRGPSPTELARLEAELASLTGPGEILRVELLRTDGTIVAGSTPGQAGGPAGSADAAAAAAAGDPTATILTADEAGPAGANLGSPTLLREFLPIEAGGTIHGAIGIWRDAVPVLARLDAVRGDVVTVTLSAALIASLLLYLVFRAAQGRISRQTAALVETARRDPLTGTLNHGALVSHLAAEIELAREAGTPLGVALLDIDNFRLLNEHHGHKAGDDAIRAIVRLLGETVPDTIVLGRYGPDEVLLVAGAAAVVELEPAIERLRTALADLSLQFEATERLPVTVSAGLCTYPEHGSSVTVLLATASQTLEEAKTSGGDAVVVAGRVGREETPAKGFDVLHGLILAIDTKDRYTKRHSEDVARYATFIAERLELDSELAASIHLAGLLHDVGKIGVPDAILRKPGRLTEDEYGMIKQHVALGDMIVRDVPGIDLVRAGIRHHHERWDGDGYLDRLAGEEIPLIARILAVGDAFSAMTTTRPYRKALSVGEALRRLEDASGSQLDERLVRIFVDGIEGAADPPLPGVIRTNLWTPRRAVA